MSTIERSRWPKAERPAVASAAPLIERRLTPRQRAALIDDPEYRRNLAERLNARKLAPALECMLWYYAKGKPREIVGVDAEQHITVSWQD